MELEYQQPYHAICGHSTYYIPKFPASGLEAFVVFKVINLHGI
jgi:hypothetical protein